ncbi:MAG: GAF domain-containing protein, partial [Sphingopyxis sp.]
MPHELPHAHPDRVMKVVASPTQAATSPIAASWCRSANHHGLEPDSELRRSLLPGAEMAMLRQQNDSLLRVARPVLDQLFTSVGRTGCCVVLSNADGIILESRATDGDRRMFEGVGLTPGARWSESTEGTNGIGTCIAEQRAVIIHRDQHFAARNIGISCMDAPVHDSAGRLVAALDVSSCRDDHSETMASLIATVVQDAARRIERDFFVHAFAGSRIVMAPDDGAGTAMLAVDRDDIVIGASRAARLRYRLTDASFARPRTATEILGEAVQPSF